MDLVRVTAKQSAHRSGLWSPVVGPSVVRLGKHLVSTGKLDTLESFGRVRDEAVRVLQKCVPPGGREQTRTGLVIGYVQSGKTMSMTTVAALARDNGFRIVIAISGTTEILYGQSRDRFERDLRGDQNGSARWVMLGNPSIAENGALFQRLVSDWNDDRIEEKDKQPLFITVMKHHSRLQNLADLLGTGNLGGSDALIIDDEADQAGLNTRPRVPIASTTYRRILAVRGRLPKHTYLQYTATAQAIILISLLDTLSPDFADVLETGDEYTGGRAFFADRRDLVHVIPQSQLPPQAVATIEPPESLIEAMRLFFLGVAASSIAGKDRHRSMLVHPDRRTGIQRSYTRWVDSIKTNWGDVLRKAEDDEERKELAEAFNGPYEELKATNDDLPSLEKLLKKLAVEIPQTLVTEVNSATGTEVEWKNAFAHILVGGQKLDRGYTVEGLTVTYMPRGPGTWTADTIQQRARFFGYKRRYLGQCRVFLENDVKDAYENYVEHEESLRKGVIEHRDKSTRELRRAFVLGRQYRPTRQNVLTDPIFRLTTGDDWFKQSFPHLVANVALNTARVEEFMGACALVPHDRFKQHRVAADVRLASVVRHLADYSFAQDDALEAYAHTVELQAYLESEPNAVATVFLMGGDPRERTTRAVNGDEIELHQGRSSKGGQAYPGDAAMRVPDRVTIQFHWVKVYQKKESGPEPVLVERAPAIAIYLPPDAGGRDWLFQRRR